MGDTFLDQECYWVDKVTHSKKFEGQLLGKCIKEGMHSLYNLPILWFEKPFLGFVWQYKSNVKIK